MLTWHGILRRLRAAVARDAADRELDDELQLHLEMQARELQKRGLDAGAARRAAVQSFGGMDHAKEAYRDARGIPMIEHLLRDARYAVRRLRRAPAFSLGVVATIGVGVGAAVAIGALVYGVLLRPLPYPRSDRIVEVTLRTPGYGGSESGHSQATFVHFGEGATSFAAFGGYLVNDAVTLTDLEDPQRITAVMITPDAFAVLGVTPVLGQLFTETDAKGGRGAFGTVLISHQLWRDRYGSDPDIVGREIEVNRRPSRVVGVLPEGFAFPVAAARVYFPMQVTVRGAGLDSRFLNAIARLRDGVTPSDAQAELQTVILRIPERFAEITPDEVRRSGAAPGVTPLKEAVVAPVREHLRVLALTMIFVLLIATANVTNLFLLRGERLRHEIAISAALGGGTVALARRFVMEGLVLGAASALVALPIVAAALTSRFGFSARELPRLHEVTMGVGPAVATIVVALLLGAGVGALAFVRAHRVRLQDGLRTSARTATMGVVWRRVQESLVGIQVAVALALLASAALLGRSLWNLHQAELGFAPVQRSAFEVSLPYQSYGNYARAALFHAAVLDGLRAIPGVEGAELAREIPLVQENPGSLTLEYRAVGTEIEVAGAANMASPDYFRLMGIPIMRGRSFAAGDVRAEHPAIVLSASLARALFGTTDAVGRLVRNLSPTEYMQRPRDDIFFQVVGVAGDVPRWKIEAGPSRMAYFPQLRDGDGVPVDSLRIPVLMDGARYVVRSNLPLAQLAPAMRAAVRAVDARVPVAHVTTLTGVVDAATARVRLTMLLLAVSAAAALLLGVIGIYSVVSFAVAGRQREIGVRIALGATPRRIQRMVLGEGSVAVGLGTLAGVAAALYGARFAQSLLYGVSARDPLLFGVAVAVLVAVACAATWIPARRAARMDPVVVMRGDT